MKGFLLLAVIALGCIGCQPSSDPPPRPAGTVPAPAPSPTVVAQRGLFTATISDPKTFNPVISVDQASTIAVGDLFDSLVRLNPKTTEMEPMLAERWEVTADGRECTFHLRPDVRWHDGEAFTADDVVFTFDAIFDQRTPNSLKHVLTIDGQRIKVEKVDERTVRFRLPRAFAPLIGSLGVPILPQHVLAAPLAAGTFAQQWGVDTPPEKLVGTGPYRMVKYEPAQYIQYRRNTAYWMRDDEGKPLPYLEERTIRIVPNQDTMYLKFLSGETDVHNARPEEVQDLRGQGPELHVTVRETGLDTGSLFVVFNRNPRRYEKDGKRDPRLGWFTDRSFLRALAHGIDKQAMVTSCLFGFGQSAISEISPENKLFHNPNLTDYGYDLARARGLPGEAGYLDRNADGILEDAAGNRVEFDLYTNSGNQIREKMASILKEDWSRLGVQVNFKPLDFQLLVEKLDHTFDWDAILIGFTGGVEPHNGANLLRSSGNLHMWNPHQPAPATPWEAEIDRLVEEGTRELDPEKRRLVYWRIQEILHEELPMLQTVRQVQFTAFRDGLRNFEPTVWGVYRPELIRFAP